MKESSKYPQSNKDLEQHLEEQIQFLKSSAEAYDKGILAEAKRMSVHVRTLIHDTKNSKSLLGLLSKKDIPFCSTALSYQPNNLLAQSCLTQIFAGPGGGQLIARLDSTPDHTHWISFEKWWNEVVFGNLGEDPLTRKDVVLGLADQDGGAHVDPKLNEKYARYSRFNALNISLDQGTGTLEPLYRPEYVAMRQIAHEIFKTLNPKYSKNGITPPPLPPNNNVTTLRPVISFRGPLITKKPPGIIPVRYAHKTNPEDLCLCGSRKRYKDCCGKVDRRV